MNRPRMQAERRVGNWWTAGAVIAAATLGWFVWQAQIESLRGEISQAEQRSRWRDDQLQRLINDERQRFQRELDLWRAQQQAESRTLNAKLDRLIERGAVGESR